MNLRRVAKYVPRPLRRSFIDSRAHEAYQFVESVVREPARATFESPVGEFEIDVFDTWRLLDRINSGEPYEPVLMDELCQRFSETTVYYDVGSRWGIFTTLAKQAGVPESQIHGFEANREAFSLLAANHSGETTRLSHEFVGESAAELRLDEYATAHESPTLMKIDIEGAEARALRGATELLNPDTLALFVEMHPELLRGLGDTADDVLDILDSAGFDTDVCLNNRTDDYQWQSPECVSLPKKGDYLIRAT